MKTETINDDIIVFCVAASSFPAGVQEAHMQLHSKATFSTQRKYFGISAKDKTGDIWYKAGATELAPGELEKLGLEKFTVRKGEYLCIEIENYMQNMQAFSEAFKTLTADSRIDPNGYCLEWYVSDKLCKCMVPIK